MFLKVPEILFLKIDACYMIAIIGETAGPTVIFPLCRILSRTISIAAGVSVAAIAIASPVIPIVSFVFLVQLLNFCLHFRDFDEH